MTWFIMFNKDIGVCCLGVHTPLDIQYGEYVRYGEIRARNEGQS